jgi:hypothetical protein
MPVSIPLACHRYPSALCPPIQQLAVAVADSVTDMAGEDVGQPRVAFLRTFRQQELLYPHLL